MWELCKLEVFHHLEGSNKHSMQGMPQRAPRSRRRAGWMGKHDDINGPVRCKRNSAHKTAQEQNYEAAPEAMAHKGA